MPEMNHFELTQKIPTAGTATPLLASYYPNVLRPIVQDFDYQSYHAI